MIVRVYWSFEDPAEATWVEADRFVALGVGEQWSSYGTRSITVPLLPNTHVLEPIFERDFAPQSYGFRPGKGCKDALRRVDELLKGGSHWVVNADLKSYFDTIPQESLMDCIREKVGRDNQRWPNAYFSDRGTPQGAVMSPLYARLPPTF